MQNFVQEGCTLTVTAPYDVASGGGVKVGALFGVAAGAALSGAEVQIQTRGVFDLTTLGTDTPAQGAAAYWDDTNKRLTTTASGNTLVGAFTVAKAAGVTTGRVRLNV